MVLIYQKIKEVKLVLPIFTELEEVLPGKFWKKQEVDFDIKVKDWNDDQISKIRKVINDEFKVEGEFRSIVQMNIKGLWILAVTEVFVIVLDYR